MKHNDGATTRTTRAYDARGLISLIRHTKTDGTLLELASYSYDPTNAKESDP